MCLFLCHAEEDPVISLDGREVFLRLPGLGFSSVPSVHPSPDGLIDHRIYRTEGFVADDMPVVVRPTSNHRVEFLYQFPSRQGFIGLHDRSGFLKECFHILFRRSNEQLVSFPRLVLAYVLTEEIKSILNMCDDGLLC